MSPNITLKEEHQFVSGKIRALDVVVVTEKKRSLNLVTILAIIIIVALFVLSGVLAVYVQQDINSQNQNKKIASLQNQLDTPKLISIGLQYTDNRSNTNAPALQITGYVVNVGTAKANNCTIYVTAIQSGNVTAIDTSATIPSVDAGAYDTVNLQFPYTGQALEAYTSGLTWTN